jgi:hypothetical protein
MTSSTSVGQRQPSSRNQEWNEQSHTCQLAAPLLSLSNCVINTHTKAPAHLSDGLTPKRLRTPISPISFQNTATDAHCLLLLLLIRFQSGSVQGNAWWLGCSWNNSSWGQRRRACYFWNALASLAHYFRNASPQWRCTMSKSTANHGYVHRSMSGYQSHNLPIGYALKLIPRLILIGFWGCKTTQSWNMWISSCIFYWDQSRGPSSLGWEG